MIDAETARRIAKQDINEYFERKLDEYKKKIQTSVIEAIQEHKFEVIVDQITPQYYKEINQWLEDLGYETLSTFTSIFPPECNIHISWRD